MVVAAMADDSCRGVLYFHRAAPVGGRFDADKATTANVHRAGAFTSLPEDIKHAARYTMCGAEFGHREGALIGSNLLCHGCPPLITLNSVNSLARLQRYF
jgi:hypothetical protein